MNGRGCRFKSGMLSSRVLDVVGSWVCPALALAYSCLLYVIHVLTGWASTGCSLPVSLAITVYGLCRHKGDDPVLPRLCHGRIEPKHGWALTRFVLNVRLAFVR